MIKISIIIPTVNRAVDLEKTLISLTKQTLPKIFFEVIVVDNGSTDNTNDIINIYKEKFIHFNSLYDNTPGLHIGRHIGLLNSKAEILSFIDDDIEATPIWLQSILASFEDEKVVLVGGKNLPKFETEPPKWLLKRWDSGEQIKIIESLSVLDLGNKTHTINPSFVFGCNFSIRKNIVFQAGGFHPDGMPDELIRFRGDGETHISNYILEKGLKTIYNPKVSIYHKCSSNRMTQDYFNKRAFNQGISVSYEMIRNGKKNTLRYLKWRLSFFLKKYLFKGGPQTNIFFLKGFFYHQSEIKKDSNLLNWVKREEYITNGKIYD